MNAASLAQYNARFSVSILGGDSARTAIQADGGNIRDRTTGNTSQNISQESVREFQLSSVNFDLSTGVSSVGSVNIVTRGGGNDFGEVFNAFNVANPGGLAFNLLDPGGFGKPTSRAGQVFGSDGPRAFQVGGRLSFQSAKDRLVTPCA